MTVLVQNRHITRALSQAGLLTAGLEGLRGSWLAGAVSHLVSLLIVMLFAIGLGVRFTRWLRDAIRSTAGKARGADRTQRPLGRSRAENVPVRRPKPKDDDPPLRLFE